MWARPRVAIDGRAGERSRVQFWVYAVRFFCGRLLFFCIGTPLDCLAVLCTTVFLYLQLRFPLTVVTGPQRERLPVWVIQRAWGEPCGHGYSTGFKATP